MWIVLKDLKIMTMFADGAHFITYLAHKLSLNTVKFARQYEESALLFSCSQIKELHVHDNELSAVMPGDQVLTGNISQKV
ncbi:hypothetical protein T4E_6356 [Trichinella pseudospiralis]|uniref:Uncharacterized protein n=1 Tax=Trichinella pseudospiralis TaxID=6337 RepID=A0A0V0XFM1_TRIPS|nr:hypothetical protein T4E_6356 [Trichinella pseudospiralis]